MRNGTVAIGLMSVVIVALLFMSYLQNTDRVTSMTYEQFQRIW
jgi:hypothetical protein